MMTIMKPTPQFGNVYQNKTMQRVKSKQMIADINLSFQKTTEQQMANAHVNFTPKEFLSVGERTTCELPVFRRLDFHSHQIKHFKCC